MLTHYSILAALHGRKPTLARLARECGLYDYREARRILKDLEGMGATALIEAGVGR